MRFAQVRQADPDPGPFATTPARSIDMAEAGKLRGPCLT
jgi:hypothetical protein